METGVLSDNDIPEIDVSHLPQEFSSAARMPVPDERSALLGNAARRRAGDTVRIVDENFERVGDEYDNDNDDDDDDLPQETSEYVLHEIIDETKPYPRTAMLHLMLCCSAMACAYSGVNAILPLFLSDFFGAKESFAVALTAIWTIVIQAIAPLCAAVGDRYASNFQVQRFVYVLWFVGLVLSVVATLPVLVDYVGRLSWIVIALASLGTFLQAISFGVCYTLQPIFVGDQHTQPTALRQSFTILYFVFNVGELIGELVAPVLRQTFGVELAFIFCTAFAFAALVALASGANSFVHKHNASNGGHTNRNKINNDRNIAHDNDKSSSSSSNIRHNRNNVVVDDDDDDDEEKPSLLRSLRHDWRDIRNVVALYVAMPMYWALYVQHNSTWVYQGRRMDLRITHTILMPPDAMAAVEDVAVLLSLLAIDRIIEPALRSCDIAFRPLRKMGVGFLLCAASFACAASLESAITRSDVKVSIAWQVPQVVLLGISEALVATAALAFGYEEVPPRARSAVSALWSITAAIGGIVVISTAQMTLSPATSFWSYSSAMLIFVVVFAFVSKPFRYRNPI